MSWKSLAVPLAVIVVGMVIIVLVLTTPDRRSGTGAGDRSVTSQEDPPCSSYPSSNLPPRCVTATPPTNDPAYPDQTTTTVTSTTPETATTTVTVTTTTTTITPETTSPAVITAQPSAPTAPPEEVLTPDVTEAEPEAAAPEATPVSVLTCAPGERILITGQGPPRAPFLLHFGQRVVGGGSVSSSGSFSIPLVVGRERPGTYPVIVRVRGSEQVLRELTCEVPPAAPPTPI
jgi:hypothetical protein